MGCQPGHCKRVCCCLVLQAILASQKTLIYLSFFLSFFLSLSLHRLAAYFFLKGSKGFLFNGSAPNQSGLSKTSIISLHIGFKLKPFLLTVLSSLAAHSSFSCILHTQLQAYKHIHEACTIQKHYKLQEKSPQVSEENNSNSTPELDNTKKCVVYMHDLLRGQICQHVRVQIYQKYHVITFCYIHSIHYSIDLSRNILLMYSLPKDNPITQDRKITALAIKNHPQVLMR